MDQQDGATPLPELLTSRVAFLLQMVTARVQAAGEIALRELDINGREYGVLAVLSNDRAPTQHEIGTALGIDRTTMMTLVAGLEARGLVERTRDHEDRRAYLVASTTEGDRTRSRAATALIECEDQFLAALDPDERAQLLRALQRLA